MSNELTRRDFIKVGAAISALAGLSIVGVNRAGSLQGEVCERGRIWNGKV